MKINIDVKEFKELVKLLTPQVTVVDGGPPQLALQQSPLAPLPTMSEVQTTEKDYFETVAKLSEPTNADRAAALAVAVANGFEYESKTNGSNGREQVSLSDQIAAANALIPHN